MRFNLNWVLEQLDYPSQRDRVRHRLQHSNDALRNILDALELDALGENESISDRKKNAVDALNVATTLVYNIPGDRWQMAYEMLEPMVNNLKIEVGESK